MVRLGWLLIVGCTTTSATGAFVKDVRIADGTVVVTSCDLEFVVTELTSRNEQLHMQGCRNVRFAFPKDNELAAAAPEGCVESVERWQLATIGNWSQHGREQLWHAMAPPCRAFIEEHSR